MKTKAFAVFITLLVAFSLASAQIVHSSPSGHRIAYRVIDSINHNVQVTSIGLPYLDSLHCGRFIVVPDSISDSGISYAVTSLKQNCTQLNYNVAVVVQLPATIQSLESRAFNQHCNVTPVFRSQIPPTVDSSSFLGCSTIVVPCGKTMDYQNAWGNATIGKTIIEQPSNNISVSRNIPIYESPSNVSITFLCSDSSVTLQASSNNYFVFSHWWDGSQYSTRTIHINRDTALYANFTNALRVTYRIEQEGYGTVEGPTMAPWGDSVTLIAHANFGYEFVRWYYPSNSYGLGYSEDSILTYCVVRTLDQYGAGRYARASFRQRTVSFEAYSDNEVMGTVYCENGSQPLLSQVCLRAHAFVGYHFTHWSDGDTNAVRVVTLTQDTIFIAYFEGNPVEVSVTNMTPELGSFTGDGIYHYGDTVTLFAHPIEHYHFLSWINNSYGHVQVYEEDTLAFVVTQDTVFELRFEIDRHHVEVTPNNIAYGSVYGTNDYEYGTAASVGAHPYSGYQFLRWSNGVTYNPYTFAVLCDTSLTAIFAEEGTVYNVTATANDPAMGIVTGGSIYAAGEQATLSAVPYDGYRFNHWQDNNTDNPRTITVNSDMSFTAYFKSDGTQGIEDMSGETEEVRVYASNGYIVIGTQATTPTEVHVYDITGRHIATAIVAVWNTARVPVPGNGVYIVKVTNLPAKKVVVIR